MITAIWIAFAVVACVWLLIVAREVRYLNQAPKPAPATDRRARIDAAIAAETHPGRRMALLMIRDNDALEDLS